MFLYSILAWLHVMPEKRSPTNVYALLPSLTLAGLMITSTGLSGMNAAAQSNSSSNMSSASVTNATSSARAPHLNKTMAELESSNNPQDIATLAYIWGYPLVSVVRASKKFIFIFYFR